MKKPYRNLLVNNIISKYNLKNKSLGAEEMAHSLRTLTTLPEDLVSISRTHMVAMDYAQENQ